MYIGIYNDRTHALKAVSPLRIREYLKVAEALQINLAFFGIEQVDMESKRILASVYENGFLREEEISFPHLVINEGNVASSRKLDPDKEILFRDEVHFLSPLIDNKFVITKILEDIPSLRTHLVPTLHISDMKPFLSMKTQKKYVVKPHNGSQGSGISIIEKQASGQFRLFEDGHELTISWKDLLKRIQQWIKAKNFIFQPFIHSQTPSGETFHLRCHICRGTAGKWFIIATIADVAKDQRLISNHSGADTYHADAFLYEHLQHAGIQLYQKLHSLTLAIAVSLEAHYPYSLNELAMDFGVDAETGTLYFFEANTGPEIIAFAEERERLRAKHRLTYATQVHKAIDLLPEERRRGLVFKLEKK